MRLKKLLLSVAGIFCWSMIPKPDSKLNELFVSLSIQVLTPTNPLNTLSESSPHPTQYSSVQTYLKEVKCECSAGLEAVADREKILASVHS